MKIYLAHNWDARQWLREFVTPLVEAAGHIVTSSWLMCPSFIPEVDAVTDLEDIRRADALIHFAQNYSERPGRGKFVELGFALHAGKRCIVIGAKTPVDCVFYALPNVRHAESIEVALKLV